MKKRSLGSLFVCGVMLTFTSCMQNVVVGKGDKTTESRNLSTFTAVDIATPVDAVITMDNGNAPTVELDGYKNVFPHIKTEIRGNTLYVFTDKHVKIDNKRGIIINIHMPRLTALSMHGVSDVVVKNTVTGDNFTLKASGAGDIDIDDIRVHDFTIDISGVADITVKNGVADHASYTLSGAGDIDVYPLAARDVVASVSGVGDIKLNATETLDASVSGAGSINYKGHPLVKARKKGVGSIEDAN